MATRRVSLVLFAFLFLFLALSVLPVKTMAAGGLECLAGSREIVLSPWGGFDVTDTFSLRNTGNVTLSAAALQLPKDARNVAASDDVSSISTSVSERNDSRAVDVTLRYPLRGSVGNSSYNDRYNFSVRYSLDYSSRVKQLSFDKLRLNASLATGINIVVPRWTVKVTLPEGASFDSSVPAGLVKKDGLATTVSFALTNVAPSQPFPLSLDYGYFPLWSLYRPAQWIGITAVLIGAIVLARRRRPKRGPRVEGRNVEVISSFAGLIEEELSLWTEEEELEVAFDKRSIGRKDYNRRKGVVQQRLRSVTGSLGSTKQKLRQSEPQLAGVLDRIDAAERETAAVRSEMARLRAQQRTGKLSRGILEKAQADNSGRMERARSGLESAIGELRDEVR